MQLRFIFHWQVPVRWQLIESVLRREIVPWQGRSTFEFNAASGLDTHVAIGAIAMILKSPSCYAALRERTLTLQSQEPIVLPYDVWQTLVQGRQGQDLLQIFLNLLFEPEELQEAEIVLLTGRPPEEKDEVE